MYRADYFFIFLFMVILSSLAQAKTPTDASYLWEITEAFNYSTGKFGTDDVTKVYEYDTTLRRYFKYGDVAVTIPYVKQRSPRDVVVETTTGQTVNQDLDTSKRVSDGIGDVTLDGTYYFLVQDTHMPWTQINAPLDFNLIAHIKFPTASLRKALGTHQWDGGPGFGVKRTFFDTLSVFSDVTYTMTGNLKGAALQNVLYSGTGVGYNITQKFNVTVTYDVSNAESKESEDAQDISTTLNYTISDRVSVYTTFAAGLSTGSPRQLYEAGFTVGF